MTAGAIAVIGGGVAGLSAAAALSDLAPVTVLEAEGATGFHASGRSAAMFLADYGNGTVRALNHASAPYLHEHEGGVLSPRGFLLLARRGADDVFDAERTDQGATEIDLREAADRFPILDPRRIGRAAWRGDIYDLDTDRLMQGFLRRARAGGARIVTGAQVQRIARDDGEWQIVWSGGEMRAAALVNAAGAWADRIAALAGLPPLGLRPYRRSMALLPAPGGRDVADWPFVEAAGGEWYAKPDAGRWLVSPCDEDAAEPQDAWADDMVLAEGLDRYAGMVTEPVTRLERSWAGLRTFAPDRALVIGADPAAPGFWWCAGQGGYGFQTAPAAGRLLADLIGGRAPELGADCVAALSPVRLRQTSAGT